jgi:hypothetical protein
VGALDYAAVYTRQLSGYLSTKGLATSYFQGNPTEQSQLVSDGKETRNHNRFIA